MNTGDVLLSYCDRRYSTGNVYLNAGLTLSHISDPGFFYITGGGAYAGTRYQWQKHLLKDKLPIFDETLTADANMSMNNYFKVWDCGQFVFHLTKE